MINKFLKPTLWIAPILYAPINYTRTKKKIAKRFSSWCDVIFIFFVVIYI